MRYLIVALAAVTLWGAYEHFASRPIDRLPGVLAADEPRQTEPSSTAPIEHGDFKLIPRAAFTAEVRVLSRSRYRIGALASVSPLDIAVGWGPMSDSAVLEEIEITQANRFYFWHYDEEPPIARRVIETHSANWHLVPASPSTWKALQRIRVNDIVTIGGELVDLERPDIGTVSTSLRRDDTGAGACEVVLVESVSIHQR